MNVREHVVKGIYAGLGAKLCIEGVASGVQFSDGEFIPFAELGYNSDLGYFRFSDFPDEQSDCTNENPETIHRYGAPDGWEAYVWRDADGYLHQLGEIWQVADLAAALMALLQCGDAHPDVVYEDDPGWGMYYTIGDAVKEAIDDGWPDEPQTANTIRAAARAGRIAGARQDANNRWILHKRQFRHWLIQAKPRRDGR